MEEQLKQRMEALTQVRRPNQVRRGIISRHIISSLFLFLCTLTFPRYDLCLESLSFLTCIIAAKCFLITFQLISSNNNNLLLHVLYTTIYMIHNMIAFSVYIYTYIYKSSVSMHCSVCLCNTYAETHKSLNITIYAEFTNFAMQIYLHQECLIIWFLLIISYLI